MVPEHAKKVNNKQEQQQQLPSNVDAQGAHDMPTQQTDQVLCWH